MSLSKSSIRLVLVLSLGIVVALILGVFTPVQWHGPTILVALAGGFGMVFTVVHRQNVFMSRWTKDAHHERGAQLKSLQSAMRLQAARSAADEKRLRQIGQLAKSCDETSRTNLEALHRLEGHNLESEKRLRQIGQLAKSCDETSRTNSEALHRIEKHDAESEKRLRQIGQIVKEIDADLPRPKPAYIPISQRRLPATAQAAGRLAAAVPNDPSRGRRLLESVHVNPAPGSTIGNGRRVGLFGTSALQNHLGILSSTCSYLPSMAMAQNDSYSPTTIVIEERALGQGVWAGSLSPIGIGLYDEITQVVADALDQGKPVYFVRNRGVADVHTDDLASKCFQITSESIFEDAWSHDISFEFLERLRSFCQTESRGNQ